MSASYSQRAAMSRPMNSTPVLNDVPGTMVTSPMFVLMVSGARVPTNHRDSS